MYVPVGPTISDPKTQRQRSFIFIPGHKSLCNEMSWILCSVSHCNTIILAFARDSACVCVDYRDKYEVGSLWSQHQRICMPNIIIVVINKMYSVFNIQDWGVFLKSRLNISKILILKC